MPDHRIIVPAFIDRPVPGIAELVQSEDTLIAPGFGEGKQVECVLPVHQALADAVERTLKEGKRPVALMAIAA